MDAPVLMQKLMEIERALSRHDECAVRNLIIAVQDDVLALEQENEALALENAGLRQRLSAARHATMPFAAHSRAFPGSSGPEPPRERLCADEEPAPNSEAAAPDPNDDRPPRTWRITHFFFS
ncbi:MAG TPA: hypothetical protein VHE33_06815 [Acidobacteriaceae bacterium]|nr:hypothetical protein [Acidobacteriaceae bacterium]